MGLLLPSHDENALPRFLFSLKPEKLEQGLDRHAESARRKPRGRVSLPEFAAQLEVPQSEALQDLFSLFDEVGSPPIQGWGGHRCPSLSSMFFRRFWKQSRETIVLLPASLSPSAPHS